jgi:hypothetical protein
LAAGAALGATAGEIPPTAAAAGASTTEASWTAAEPPGGEGSGLGESNGQPCCEKSATIPRPAAAVIPSSAKVVLRILSGRPWPARLNPLVRCVNRCPILPLTYSSIGG